MPKHILDEVKEKAKKLGRAIVLTESDDVRNLQAAAELARTGYAQPVLVGDEAAIDRLAHEHQVSLAGVEVVDIQETPRLPKYVATVVELRKSKGMTEAQARDYLKDTCNFAAAMVAAGDAHGTATSPYAPLPETRRPRRPDSLPPKAPRSSPPISTSPRA